ncbi:MAG: carboxypeptidase-like regulatory domain-containing protein [Thermoanaerobaculia bacterium]
MRLRALTASRSYEARAGDDGRFSIERAAEGSYDVEARKRGYATAEIFEAFEVAGAPVDGLQIVLRAGASVVGHVLGLTFEELAAVQVEARRNGQQGREGSVAYDGRYEVADLSAGDWQLLARVPGSGRQAEARVTIERGIDQLVRDLEFGGGLVLQGRVSHRGQSLGGADVSLTGLDVATRRTVTTDHEGGFRFDDLQAGNYRLDAVHRAELLVHGEELELSSDRTVDIDIWTAAARGTVTSAAGAGAPLAGAVVSLQRFGPASGDLEGPLFTAGTESDGRFQVVRLGEGSYRVVVRKVGFLPAEETADVFAGVDLDSLDFALTPADGLDVFLQLASGRRVPTASVHVFDGAGQLVQTEIQPVAEDGHVRFSLAAGSWDVLVSAPGAVARRIAVTVPSEAQAVVLQESALLRIRVPALMESNRTGTLTLSGPDGRLVESVDASGTLRRDWSVPGGVASIDGVPAGVWTLELVADGQTWRQTATLAAGLESEVTLQ